MLGELGTQAGGTGSPDVGEPVPRATRYNLSSELLAETVSRRWGHRLPELPDTISLPNSKNPKASLVGEKVRTPRQASQFSQHVNNI